MDGCLLIKQTNHERVKTPRQKRLDFSTYAGACRMLCALGCVVYAGQTPKEGTPLKYQGQLGKDLTTRQGYSSTKLCALRLLSVLHASASDLENIECLLKLTVAGPDFSEYPQVANGASDLLHDVLGDAGVHVSSAVGTSSLPGDADVEFELIAQIS